MNVFIANEQKKALYGMVFSAGQKKDADANLCLPHCRTAIRILVDLQPYALMPA
jgi:hypothetical protein